MNCVSYRVYNQKGQYHHCYSNQLNGALDWAIDCAKSVQGSVKEVSESKVKLDTSKNMDIVNNIEKQIALSLMFETLP